LQTIIYKVMAFQSSKIGSNFVCEKGSFSQIQLHFISKNVHIIYLIIENLQPMQNQGKYLINIMINEHTLSIIGKVFEQYSIA